MNSQWELFDSYMVYAYNCSNRADAITSHFYSKFF